jgi:hypothetical protein
VTVATVRFPRWLRDVANFQEHELDEPHELEVRVTAGARAFWVARGGTIDASTVKTASERWPAGVDILGVLVCEPSELREFEVNTATGLGKTGWATREVWRLAEKLGSPAARAMDVAVLRQVVRLSEAAAGGRVTVGDAESRITDLNGGVRATGDLAETLTLIDAHARPMVLCWRDSQFGREMIPERIGREVVVRYFDDLIERDVLHELDASSAEWPNLLDEFPLEQAFALGNKSLVVGQWGGIRTNEWSPPNEANWFLRASVQLAAAIIPAPTVAHYQPAAAAEVPA